METNTLYKCRSCHMACKNSAQLETHERTHQEETVVTCRDCGEHFESESFLGRHFCPAFTGTKSHGFHCKFCVMMFATDAELQKHMQEYCHGVEKFHCQLCNSNFLGSHDLQRHMEVHHASRKYMCPICQTKFESKHLLECHLQEHKKTMSDTRDTWRGVANSDRVCTAESSVSLSSGLEPFFCNVCGQTFNQEEHLHQHLDGHFQRKSYECDICNSRFSGPFFLEHHMNVHNSARPYICSQCGTGYRQKDSLMKHFVIHGVPKLDNLSEQLQDTSSSDEVMLTDMFTTDVQEENDTSALIQNKGDEQVGSDEINFSDLLQTCDTEENESIFGPSLPGQDGFIHIHHSHEDKLPKSAFQNEKQLQPNYPEVHSLPMPVKGDKILSAANQKSMLEPTSHSGITCKDGRKTFPCDLCSKVFNTKAHCQRHRRIHTGEMPYDCKVCRRKFMWRSSFVTHSCLKPCERRRESNSTTCNISVVDSEKHPNDQQQDCGGKHAPEAIGHSEVFICSVCGKNLSTEILLQSHMSVHDGPKPGPAMSESQIEWQNDRIDPVENVALTGTVHAEDNHSILPVTDTEMNQIPHPTNNIVHQKHSPEGRKWSLSLRSRQSSECRNTYTTSYSNTVKEKKIKVFVCEVCSKVSLSQNHYLRHRRLHTGEKPFACDRCERKFMWKSSLDSHKSSHDKKDKHSKNDDVVSVSNCGPSDEPVREQSGWTPAEKGAKGLTRAFICLQCGKSFASEPELQRHVSLHEGTECFTESASKTDSEVAHVSHRARNVVSNQQRKVHRRKDRKNHHTGKFNSISLKRNAVSKRTRRVVCEYCSKVFNNPSCYQRHLPFHTGEMAYQCDLCDKKFKWSSSLHSHKKSHNRKKAHVHTSGSDMVPFDDSRKSGELMQGQMDRILERNDRNGGDKMFMCSECGMRFASDMQLQSHKLIHEDPLSRPRNEMDILKLSGKTGGAVQQRKSKRSASRQKKPNSGGMYIPPETYRVHEQNTKKFVCEICNKVFHVKQHYHRHKRIHTQEMPFKCHQCDKVFKWRSSLYSHKKSHSKKKSPASNADYVSVIANELTQETVPELNEDRKSSSATVRPFVCPQCGKDYASDLELQIHMFIHGDEDYLKMHTPLGMDGTDSGKSNGLVSHATRHSTASDASRPRLSKVPENREKCSPEESSRAASETGSKHGQKKKNFTCEVCGKSFISQNHYRRHMPLHTGEMPYECERCNRKFKWRSSLDSHKKSHDKKDACITDIEYMTFIDSDEDF